MAKLWQVGTTVGRQSPPTHALLRISKASAAVVADLFNLRQQRLIFGKPKLAEATHHAVPRRATFERFLTHGQIELDSSIVERAIRPPTITRNNRLFAGNDGGGRTWATIATLLQTAKTNNVDPFS